MLPDACRGLSAPRNRNRIQGDPSVRFSEPGNRKGAVDFKPIDADLTFQDPCRLLQEAELKPLPRKLIGHLKARSFREISESETGPICCGGCAWNGCDAYVKAMQVNRLRQARAGSRRHAGNRVSQMPDSPQMRHGRSLSGPKSEHGG